VHYELRLGSLEIIEEGKEMRGKKKEGEKGRAEPGCGDQVGLVERAPGAGGRQEREEKEKSPLEARDVSASALCRVLHASAASATSTATDGG